MRPPTQQQNHFLHPLNQIIGTEANVRLLRVLSYQDSQFTAGELAKRAMLSRTSIYPALRALERAGIVEFIGTGSRRLVRLRKRHPLSRALRELFLSEASQFDALTAALRELVSKLPNSPLSAWIDETTEIAQSTDTLRLYVVARPEELAAATDHLNDHLADVERKYDVHIAVHGLTRSELERVHDTQGALLDTVALVGGVPPSALLQRSAPETTAASPTSHAEHDARARKLAVAIAAKIKRDPGLIAIAQEGVTRRTRKASAGERRELAEWTRILSTMSPARLRRFLVEDSERAVRLRQTLPALNLLSPVERQAVLRSKTDADVVAAITQR